MTVHQRLLAIGALFAVLAISAGCSGTRLTDLGDTAYAVSGSGSDTGAALPPPVVRSLNSTAMRSEFVRTAAPGDVAPPPAPRAETLPPNWTTPPPQNWSQPAPVTRASPTPVIRTAPATGTWAGGTPQPPPPPYGSAPTTTAAPCPTPCPTPIRAASPPVAAVPLPQRTWAGCGLPCEDGISSWHVRGVGGVSFYFGDDVNTEPCTYWGADFGRTFCGCWGLDLYWRVNSAQFDRRNEVCLVDDHDGGYMNHFGAKLTMERAFGQSRWYWWAGLGGGYFITEDFLVDDEGWEAFGELGIGYMFSKTFRVRAGVNAHAMDTTVGRYLEADDNESRLLWVVAPVLELQVDF